MDQLSLEAVLADLKLPALCFFATIDSTNNEANRWIEQGAPHLALIVADEQTAGRGRSGRHWITPPGAGLAFSLLLHSPMLDAACVSRLTGLGALAVQHALQVKYSLQTEIKWPNDVLLNGRKVAGVLVETHWIGDVFRSAIIGIGINISAGSIEAVNRAAEELSYPATCVEAETTHPVNRLDLLHDILQELLSQLPRLPDADFIGEWESVLAFRNQWVELTGNVDSPNKDKRDLTRSKLVGKVLGLTVDGCLRLLTSSGVSVIEPVGDILLRPVPFSQSVLSSV